MTEKVEIKKDAVYAGTSMPDVFQQRQVNKDKMQLHKVNNFMRKPADLRHPLEDEHDKR